MIKKLVTVFSTLLICLVSVLGFNVDIASASAPTNISVSNPTNPSWVNDPHIYVSEEQGANAYVATLSTTDPNSSSFTYSLVSGTGDTHNVWFTISGNQIKTAYNLDYEFYNSWYHIRVRSTDPQGNYREERFYVFANNIDEGNPGGGWCGVYC